jgi:hypothetical protein
VKPGAVVENKRLSHALEVIAAAQRERSEISFVRTASPCGGKTSCAKHSVRRASSTRSASAGREAQPTRR